MNDVTCNTSNDERLLIPRILIRVWLRVFVVLSIFMIHLNAVSQTIELDSMIQRLAFPSSDTSRIKLLNAISRKYLAIGKLDEVVSYSDSMLLLLANLREKVAEDSIVQKFYSDWSIQAHSNKGFAFRNSSEYEAARKSFQNVLHFSRTLNDQKQTSYALHNIGTVFFYDINYDSALIYYLMSLEIKIQLGDQKGQASGYTNVGHIYYRRGDFSKALAYHARALEISESFNDAVMKANVINNIGTVYYQQGNYSDALDYFTRSLKEDSLSGSLQSMNASCNNIAVMCKMQGNFEKALEYYQLALDAAKKFNNIKLYATTLYNVGNCYFEMGDMAMSMQNYKHGYEELVNTNDHTGLANILNGMSTVLLELGNPDQLNEAKTNALESLEHTKMADSPGHMRDICRTLVNCYQRSNERDSALTHLSLLRRFLMDQLGLNYFTLSEREKQLYFSTMESDFGLYHEFAVAHHKNLHELADTGYNLAISTKGLSLRSSTMMRKLILESRDSSLLSSYDLWIKLRKKISGSSLNSPDLIKDERIASELERDLIKRSEVFQEFERFRNLDWKDIQADLKSDEAAIEFVQYKVTFSLPYRKAFAAYVINSNCDHPIVVPLCDLDELSAVLLKSDGNNINSVNSIYGSDDSMNLKLYELIWKPIEHHLKNVTTVYYSPTGLLHKVSFSAIRTSATTFLCDKFQLHQQGSTSTIILDNETTEAPIDSVLLFGGAEFTSKETVKNMWDYLPGTLEEIRTIEHIVNKARFNPTTYLASAASEENFKLYASGSTLIHLATHGFFYPDPESHNALQGQRQNTESDLTFRGGTNYANWSFVKNKNPLMRSGLVLAGANSVWNRDPLAEGEDGILTAQEVSNLNLSTTKLVVLSACETGLGDIKGSEGVYGLQRAFKMAGVKYIIMSLWQVPDKETAEFMTLFYKNLTKVSDIRKAFAMTQRSMREKYDPYYWAAFVLVE